VVSKKLLNQEEVIPSLSSLHRKNGKGGRTVQGGRRGLIACGEELVGWGDPRKKREAINFGGVEFCRKGRVPRKRLPSDLCRKRWKRVWEKRGKSIWSDTHEKTSSQERGRKGVLITKTRKRRLEITVSRRGRKTRLLHWECKIFSGKGKNLFRRACSGVKIVEGSSPNQRRLKEKK